MAHSNEPIGSARDLAGKTPHREGEAPARLTSASSVEPSSPKSAGPTTSGFKLTQTAAILGAFVLIIGGVLLLLQLFVARRLPEMTEARFDAAEALWKQNGPASYDMDLNITGAQPGQVHIKVRDGKTTAMQRDGMAPPERTWDTWTVPGQFQTLVEEFALKEDPNHKGQGAPGAEIWLRCEFDPKYGYPRTYQRLMTGGGPQVEWHVTKFEPK